MKGEWKMNHNIFMILSVVSIVLSIVMQVVVGVIFQNMINETDNMTSTDNKMLKQCKLKFMNCYKLNDGVSNIPIFADKFINRLKFGKISLVALQHLSGQLVLASVFISGIGIYFGITGGERLLNLLPYYIVSMFGIYLYFSVSSAVDISGKKKILQTNLVDYLENHMVNRLKTVPKTIEELEEKENADIGVKKALNEAADDEKDYKDDFENDYENDYEEITQWNAKSGKLNKNETKDLAANSSSILANGSRQMALERARGNNRSSQSKTRKDSLSDEELQALLTEFLT